MESLKRSVLLVLTVFAGLLVTSPAMANEALIADLGKVLEHTDFNEDPAIFDGTQFLVGEDEALEYYNKRVSRYNQVIGIWNRLRPSERSEPEVVELHKRMGTIRASNEAMEKIFAAKEASRREAKKRAEGQCSPFREQVINKDKDRKGVFARLIGMVEGGYKSDDLERPDQIAAHRAALEVIDAECAKPEFAVFTEANLCRYNVQPVDDPFRLCQVAGHQDEVLGAYIANFGTRAASVALGLKADNVRRAGNHWVNIEKSYVDMTELTPAHKKAVLDVLGPLYEAAGIASPDPTSLWEWMAAEQAKNKAFIDETAPTVHGINKGAAQHYSIKLAEPQILSFWPKAKVLKRSFPAEWELEREGIVVVARRASGYMLLKIPGEPWCRGAHFWVTEKATGKRFAPAKKAFLGSTRFQACD